MISNPLCDYSGSEVPPAHLTNMPGADSRRLEDLVSGLGGPGSIALCKPAMCKQMATSIEVLQTLAK